MNLKSQWTFYGKKERVSTKRRPGAPDLNTPIPYHASDKLVDAVNLAIYLKRPLLIEGEAGCGKTQLAKFVAWELGLPFHPWYVHSTSKAQEGLYTYDSLLRLYDVHTYQLQARNDAASLTKEMQEPLRDPRVSANYVRFGPIGEAFRCEDCPSVVLIDEIDKADIDFPNDLLAILDDPWSFKVTETGEVVSANHKPIVIITSNKEKGNLPAPFLRRCLYHFVEFPENPEQLKQIVEKHYEVRHEKTPNAAMLDKASHRFLALRSEGGLHKKPGTSEFLDWLEILSRAHTPDEAISRLNAEKLPYPEILFKLRIDWQRFVVMR